MTLTLADAKAARQRARRDADNYHLLRERRSRTTTEPADPQYVDHEQRRGTRLAPPDFDTDRLPKPLVECGCGSCSDAADPLADDSNAFRDELMAADICEDPRPVTVERAAEIYLRYQKAREKHPRHHSKLSETKARHGKMLGAERSIFAEMDDPTLIFLSLRLSPIEEQNGCRRWIEPVRLGSRLSDSWGRVRDVLDYHLREYDSEYAAITSMTTSAATPHKHALLYVEDPNDEVSIEVAEAAVDSHVRNTIGAEPDDHPVEPGESDAGMVFHEVPKAHDVPDDTLLDVYQTRRRETFSLSSVPLYYMMNQAPHWVLKNVYDATSEIHRDSIEVDGGAIAWALPWDNYNASGGFVDDGFCN